MADIGLGVVAFTVIVLFLALFVLGAKRLLVPSGEFQVTVNGRKTVHASAGEKLLGALSAEGVQLPSACGGAGTCGLCKVRALDGDGAGPQERTHMTRREIALGMRLACQFPVLESLSVEVDEASFGIATWRGTVTRARNVATLIREIVIELAEGEVMDFRAGGFVQITCPSYRLKYTDLDIEDAYRDVWGKLDLWRLEAGTDKPVTRAYSMANHPGEKSVVILNVRIALPPPHAKDIPPGIVSSWLFSLKPGDAVDMTGPFGHFFVEDTQREAVFVGGGAGMAPLRAQIVDLLEGRQSTRKISFWYGARSRRELFYAELFDRLEATHENFHWRIALSEPDPDDEWHGLTGFIDKVLLDNYLERHPAPEECEYYICGPPMMVKAVLGMLDELGVESESIHYDDFGS